MSSPATVESLERDCRSYLGALRWPDGVRCPRCDEGTRLHWLESRSKWHCYTCRYQFSLTAGTLFHQSHLPVWKWFVAVHLMNEWDGISASELRRKLGGSYKTAWFVAHRIRVAMRGRESEIRRAMVEAAGHTAHPGFRLDHALWAVGQANPDLDHPSETTDRRALALPHQHLSRKHLQAYLDERRWRLSNSRNPHAFRDTILALLQSDRITYNELTS